MRPRRAAGSGNEDGGGSGRVCSTLVSVQGTDANLVQRAAIHLKAHLSRQERGKDRAHAFVCREGMGQLQEKNQLTGVDSETRLGRPLRASFRIPRPERGKYETSYSNEEPAHLGIGMWDRVCDGIPSSASPEKLRSHLSVRRR